MTDTPKTKKGKGRPSIFTQELADKIIELAGKGMTNAQIAENLEIALINILRWKQKNIDFRSALNEAQQAVDEVVEKTLYQRAMGYSHPEEKLFYDSKTGEVVRAETIKHYPPDTSAMIFWLKNRRPKEWKENPNREIDDITFIYSDLGKL